MKLKILGMMGWLIVGLVGSVDSATASTIFLDSFTGYTAVNAPPVGWTNSNDLAIGIGVDASQSTFWLTSGNTTPNSPAGDIYYVRAAVLNGQGEGMERAISGFTAGNQYEINFYNAASNVSGGGSAYWGVFLNGLLLGDSATASVGGGWLANSLIFTATSTSQTFAFRGRGVQNSLLDEIRISDFSTSTSVPEPSTFLLLGIGLSGLGAVGYKKRERKA